jgi:hypothetical protein
LIKQRKYIAYLLLLTFIFPIGYQSLHVVSHSLEKHSQCNHKEITVGKTAIQEYITESNHCSACDYKFSLNQIPDTFSLTRVIYYYFTHVSFLYRVYCNNITFCKNSPRAPPFSPAHYMIKFNQQPA